MDFKEVVFGLGLLVSLQVLALAAGTSYNSKTQICCNGTVTNLPGPNKRLACCGHTAYDYTTSLCCLEDQVFVRPSSSYSCCVDDDKGTSALFDYTTQQCCDGDVLVKPDKKASYSCCNRQLFKQSTHLCCGDKLLEKKPYEQCCGDEVYETRKQLCCTRFGIKEDGTYGELQSKVMDRKGATVSCCDLEQFDYSKEVCCTEGIKDKPASIVNKGGSHGGCCSGEPFDYSKQVCCTTTGDVKAYDKLEGKLFDRKPGHLCCGYEQYNFKTDVCCNHTGTIPKPPGADPDNWLQCCGGEAITDINGQLCYKDQIIQRRGSDIYVCGDTTYDIGKEFCCADKLYDVNSNMACCRKIQEVYDKTTHQCCYDVIEPLSDQDLTAENDACCAVEYESTEVQPYFY